MEKFFRSLSLMALSSETRSLLRSEYLIFSKFENCRNESSSSDSTFAVAEEPAIGTFIVTGGREVAKKFAVAEKPAIGTLIVTAGREVAVITSLPSCVKASTGRASAPFGFCGACLVRFVVSDVRSRKPLSGRATCKEMIAGSTGALAILDLLVGSRRAGGMYLLVWLV